MVRTWLSQAGDGAHRVQPSPAPELLLGHGAGVEDGLAGPPPGGRARYGRRDGIAADALAGLHRKVGGRGGRQVREPIECVPPPTVTRLRSACDTGLTVYQHTAVSRPNALPFYGKK